MKPPVAPVDGLSAAAAPPAVSVHPYARPAPYVVLTKRADFLRAAQALRQGTDGFHLQARKRRDDEAASGIRIGFTCSKKVGNAVARNRAKRRLRELARHVLPHAGRDGWDYVLVGRPTITAALPLPQMSDDLTRALAKLHKSLSTGQITGHAAKAGQ